MGEFDRSIFMLLNWLVLVHLSCVYLAILVFKVTFVCFQVLRPKCAKRSKLEPFGAKGIEVLKKVGFLIQEGFLIEDGFLIT